MGGILLGSVTQQDDGRYVVQVDDFEPVPCQHAKGMTWVLNDEDLMRFEETLSRWRKQEGRRTYAVGFYRSHTRDGLGLTEDDLRIYEGYFPEESSIAMLVKPFATRTSIGALFIREGGEIHSESSYQEFPFRRTELGGDRPGPIEMPRDRRPTNGPAKAPNVGPAVTSRLRSAADQESKPRIIADEKRFALPPAEGEKKPYRIKADWRWVPLSFIFLLLGVAIGAHSWMSVSSQLPNPLNQDAYSLGLTLTPSGDGLHLRWNRTSPAVAASSRGVLYITDGGVEKVVSLDQAQLQAGSAIYRRGSKDVRVRLEVKARDRVSVSETVEFQPE